MDGRHSDLENCTRNEKQAHETQWTERKHNDEKGQIIKISTDTGGTKSHPEIVKVSSSKTLSQSLFYTFSAAMNESLYANNDGI